MSDYLSNKLELKALLNRANDAYYMGLNPIMSDSDFDHYKNYYEAKYNEKIQTMPTTKSLCNKENQYPLLASWLNKTTNEEELCKWISKMFTMIDRVSSPTVIDLNKKFNLFKLSPKYDGMSIIVIYDLNGEVVEAVTRGTETHGVDITRFFKNNRKHFDFSNFGSLDNTHYLNSAKYMSEVSTNFAIKYEAVMSYDNLELLNSEQTGKKYKNCRNTVSGIFSSLEPENYYKYITLKPLSAYSYDINEGYSTELGDVFLRELLNYADYDGLINHSNYPLDDYYYTNDGYDILKYVTLIDAVRKNIDFYDTPCKGFEINIDRSYQYDGVVVELMLDSMTLTKIFGHFLYDNEPDFIVGHKLDAPSQITTIVGIEESIGGSGAITPLIHVNPVVINGNTYSKASYSNYGQVIKDGIGYGDKVLLSLKGDIIPYLDLIEKSDGERFTLPNTTIFSYNTNGEIVNAYCDDVERFIVEKCAKTLVLLGIKGIKEQTIRILSDIGIINNYYLNILLMWCETDKDIADLKQYLLSQPNLGDIKVNYLVDTIKSVTSQPIIDSTAFSLLFIDGVSKEISSKLFENIPDMDEINSYNIGTFTNKIEYILFLAENHYEYLIELITTFDNFGNVRAKIIADGVLEYKEIIYDINSNLTIVSSSNNREKNKNQLKIVVTGELSIPRNDFKAILDSNNHILQSKVSKNTDYLVCNYSGSNSTKVKDANKLNIPIITENELFDLLGISSTSQRSFDIKQIDFNGVLDEY